MKSFSGDEGNGIGDRGIGVFNNGVFLLMRGNLIRNIVLLLLVAFCCNTVFAQTNFDTKKLLKEVPRTLVNDYSNTLTRDQVASLEQKLVAYDDSTSTQLAVVLVPNLNGNDVSDYAVELGRAWGIGGKEFNNGILLLISKEDRKLHIATGYGTEGALTDVTSKHIIDDVIVPNFKGEDYYRGVDAGTTAIMQAMRGEYKAPANYRQRSGRGSGIVGFVIFIIVMIIIAALRNRGGGGGNYMSRRGSGLADVLFWSTMLGGGGRSSGGGGWSGGGGGGGGFGGFGGGSFGGGGASGSW